MTTYKWNSASAGSASTTTNWTPNGTPATGDIVQFSNFGVGECTWDLATVATMEIGADYTGVVIMDTDCDIETGLSINAENSIKSTTSTTITFTGTPQYKSNKVYIENNVADPFTDSTSRGNLKFTFNGSTVAQVDAGIYPHMQFNYAFRPEYVAPTRTDNKYTVSMMSVFLGGQNVAPSSSSPTADDRKMNWIIAHHTGHDGTALQLAVKAGTIQTFDGGWGTWTFQGKLGGHTLPVNGNQSYGGWTFTFRNIIIDSSAGGAGAFCTLPFGSILSLTNLTINEGASIKGHGEKGATIHLVNRPTIDGTWGFFPIADGIYHYKGLYNLNVAFGGTGLVSVPDGRILFGENEQTLGHSANFTYNNTDNELTVGDGGIVIPASSISSPAANLLWVNSADSDKLYFGSSAVGSGGGGGSGTVDVVSNVATNTILGRNDAGSGDSEELTPAEVRTMLDFSAQAISAVEGTSSLDLTGDLTLDTSKKIIMDEKTYASASAASGTIELTAEKTGSNSPLLTLRTPSGYLRIGAQNASFCHFYTDRSYFYFNKAIQFDSGQLFAYNDDLQIKTDDSGSGQPTRIFIDAGVDACRVGIGNGFTSSALPQTELHVAGTIRQTNATGAIAYADGNGDLQGMPAGQSMDITSGKLEVAQQPQPIAPIPQFVEVPDDVGKMPFGWLRTTLSDGTVVYIPAWVEA